MQSAELVNARQRREGTLEHRLQARVSGAGDARAAVCAGGGPRRGAAPLDDTDVTAVVVTECKQTRVLRRCAGRRKASLIWKLFLLKCRQCSQDFPLY